jgi:hypothetical protein
MAPITDLVAKITRIGRSVVSGDHDVDWTRDVVGSLEDFGQISGFPLTAPLRQITNFIEERWIEEDD